MDNVKKMQIEYKIKYMIAFFISVIPFNFFRVFLYRFLMGYKIKKTFIGFRTIIVVNSFSVETSVIGRKNIFYGPMNVNIKKSHIGHSNEFKTELWVYNKEFSQETLTRKLTIEEDSLITNLHFFDVIGTIKIGKNTWIAGRGSEFWTHGLKTTNKNIYIGENCYIGSRVLISPGTQIIDYTVVGIGSVVKGKFEEGKILLKGNPAQIIKRNYKRHNIN